MAIGLPMDNDTSCVGVICMAGDQPLKELRRNDVFERVVRSIPRLAHWLEGDPLHDVRPMAGAMDRYRRFVIDGEPVVAGLLAVGDAWACTNPTAGRGLPLGIAHAVALRDVAGQGLDDPYGLAVAFDAVTEGKFTPWYRNQIDRDHERVALMKAAIEGREPPKPDESNPMVQMQRKFMVAANFDPDVARAFLDVMSVQHLPHEVIARPGIIDKVIAASDGRRMPEEQGPSREELLALVS
jgi:flavin-dependent dehydrogenase